MDEEGYVLFIRKNALQILIPKYGLEGTIFLANHKGESLFVYDEEASTQQAGDVVFSTFDPVTVQISIDSSNIQHQKLALKLVTPHIEGFSVESVKQKSPGDDQDEPPKKKVKTSKSKS